MSTRRFEIICEVEPPTRPDLRRLHEQIDTFSGLASRFLVPDNHTARATVSSIAVAHEVLRRGAVPIACINARDRNLLGFRRDLLTGALYGVDDVLLVYGDEPDVGVRAGGLTVQTMLEECRTNGGPRAGVTTGLRPLPGWKKEAGSLFVQVSHSIDDLLRWRDTLDFDGPVYAAVMALPSAAVARRLSARIPELRVPAPWIAAMEHDPAAGIDLACDLVESIRRSRAFSGVHLIAGARHREVAATLDPRCRQIA